MAWLTYFTFYGKDLRVLISVHFLCVARKRKLCYKIYKIRYFHHLCCICSQDFWDSSEYFGNKAHFISLLFNTVLYSLAAQQSCLAGECLMSCTVFFDKNWKLNQKHTYMQSKSHSAVWDFVLGRTWPDSVTNSSFISYNTSLSKAPSL